MKIMLWDDECLKLFGSVQLGTLQILFHHCWSLRKTEQEAALQLRFDDAKCFQRLARAWNDERGLVVFECFGRKMQGEQDAKMRE